MKRLAATAVLLAMAAVFHCPGPGTHAAELDHKSGIQVQPGTLLPAAGEDGNTKGDGDLGGPLLGDPDDYLGGNGVIIPTGISEDSGDRLKIQVRFLEMWQQMLAGIGL